MKRTLVIVVLAVLLLSTVATMAAVARDNQPAGKSNVYQYRIDIDPAGHGKLVVNEKTLTYTFEGKGCTADVTYYLYYMDAGTPVDLGNAKADTYGNVVITGSYKDGSMTRAQFAAAQVITTAPEQPEVRDAYAFGMGAPATPVGTVIVDPTQGTYSLSVSGLTASWPYAMVVTDVPLSEGGIPFYFAGGDGPSSTVSADANGDITLTNWPMSTDALSAFQAGSDFVVLYIAT